MKITPVGKVPEAVSVGVGMPVAVTVNELATPKVNVVELAEVITGDSAETVKDAEAVFPVPPSVLDMRLLVLFLVPAVIPVTLTRTVQEVFAAKEPLDKLIKLEPAVAVLVPPQVLLNPFGVATTRPAGKVSEKANPLSDELLGLVTVNVNTLELFKGIVDGLKALVNEGGPITVNEAEAGLPGPLSVLEGAVVTLFLIPPEVPFILKLKVHELLGTKSPESI